VELALDSQGNVLLAGGFDGALQFASVTLGKDVPPKAVNGDFQIFVAKLDPTGVPLAARTLSWWTTGCAWFDSQISIASDSMDDIYLGSNACLEIGGARLLKLSR
jgi:hypothetical protein